MSGAEPKGVVLVRASAAIVDARKRGMFVYIDAAGAVRAVERPKKGPKR